ncbi:MAG TPA: hypothetical protein DD740_12190 [Chryseobacterium sp.]|nr:hypothetical protein [Chryseobacterium sp.]
MKKALISAYNTIFIKTKMNYKVLILNQSTERKLRCLKFIGFEIYFDFKFKYRGHNLIIY